MKHALAILALLLPACSQQAEEQRSQLEHQQARIAELERTVADAKAAQEAKPQPAAPVRDPAIAEVEKVLTRMTLSTERIERRVAEIETRLAARVTPEPVVQEIEPPDPPIGKILPSKPPAISIYTAPDSRLADFLETPTGENGDLFPVRITSVTGRKTVTGTHTTTSIVENPVAERDEYGRQTPTRKEIREPVNEYAYEIVFSAENLTRTEKSVSFTAGGATRTLTLQPGQKMAGLALRSSLGASLYVESGGQLRDFAVTY